MSRRKPKSQYAGGCLCEGHALAFGLTAADCTVVPHYSEQVNAVPVLDAEGFVLNDPEPIECDACTVALMREAGAP